MIYIQIYVYLLGKKYQLGFGWYLESGGENPKALHSPSHHYYGNQRHQPRLVDSGRFCMTGSTIHNTAGFCYLLPKPCMLNLFTSFLVPAKNH